MITTPNVSELCDLFKTGQYGRLYVINKTLDGHRFRVYVLPKDCVAIPYRDVGILNSDAVMVYGRLDNGPFISMSAQHNAKHGWLYYGRWQNDFSLLVEEKRAERKERLRSMAIKQAQEIAYNEARIKALLESY